MAVPPSTINPNASPNVNGDHAGAGSFVWEPAHEILLERVASTEQVENSEWELLRKIIKYKVDKHVSDFIKYAPKEEPVVHVKREPQSVSLLSSSPHALSHPNPNPNQHHQQQQQQQQHPDPGSSPTLSTLSPTQSPTRTIVTHPTGGLRLPPFPRQDTVRPEFMSRKRHKVWLDPEDARELQQAVFRQLDEFEHPPFTIQRVCELASQPQPHYKSVGKYLRAIEKTLLVTSSLHSFPIEQDFASTGVHSNDGQFSLISREASTTPLFSPIPFLHDDARARSLSKSPPSSPLQMAGKLRERSGSPPSMMTRMPGHDGGEGGIPMSPAIGLVDELDDPSPGHMSDHPTALTAVTTIMPESSPGVGTGPGGGGGHRTLVATLQERFTRASESDEGAPSPNAKKDSLSPSPSLSEEQKEDQNVEDMVLDDIDDEKENKG